nr:unnamed protein product [Rangifer tarandus platyrhynchus]
MEKSRVVGPVGWEAWQLIEHSRAAQAEMSTGAERPLASVKLSHPGLAEDGADRPGISSKILKMPGHTRSHPEIHGPNTHAGVIVTAKREERIQKRAKPRSRLVVNRRFGALCRKEPAIVREAGPAAHRRPAELPTLATFKQGVGSERKASALSLRRTPEPSPRLAGTRSFPAIACLSTVASPQNAAALHP